MLRGIQVIHNPLPYLLERVNPFIKRGKLPLIGIERSLTERNL
jgi:hypothetical protein